MDAYKETVELLKFGKFLQEFEATRDLLALEDLEVYIHSIRNRFISKPDFAKLFSEGYALIRKESEAYELKNKKYHREKYLDSQE